MELQADLQGDVERQVNLTREKSKKNKILDETIQKIDNGLNLPTIHCLISQVDETNLDDVLCAISVLIHSGADVDQYRKGVSVLQRLLELENKENSKHLETVLEMIVSKSKINYKTYKDGSLLDALKDFSKLAYIKVRLLTDSEDEFLAFMSDPSYCSLIQQHLFVITCKAVSRDFLKVVRKLFEVHSKKPFDCHEMSDLLKKSVASGNLSVLMYLWQKIEAMEMTLNTPFLISTVQEVVNVEQDNMEKFYQCFDYVLQMKQTDVNERDTSGNVALYYACQHDNVYMTEELLKARTWIGNKNERGELAISRIDARLLERYLDSCIKTSLFSAQFQQASGLIFFDYSCFVPPEGDKDLESTSDQPTIVLEMDPVTFIGENSNLSHLISHPLLRAFIQLKWRRFRPFNIINQQCSLFFLIITCLILTENFKNDQVNFSELKHPILAFGAIAIFFEFIRLAMLRLQYFKQRINMLYIVSIILCFCYVFHCFCLKLDDLTTIFYKQQCESPRTCYQITGFLSLIFSIMFTILLYTFVCQTVGIYSVMLAKVAYNSIICILSNFVLFVGFSVAFFAIFNNFGAKKGESSSEDGNGINNFSTILKAVYKVYLMFTGEMDAADLNYMDTWNYLLLAIFIFIGPIVAFNLLNGLAVDDVHEIRCEAERISLRILCSLVADFEYMLHSPFLGYYNRFMNQVFQVPTNLISIFHRNRMPFGRMAVDLITCKAYTFPTRYAMFDQRNKKFLYQLERSIVKDAEKIVMGDLAWQKRLSKTHK
ncbi:transient receptor potential cation channel protein painless-like [Culicoides brevitarsis]|uniref:transient receptor potential cation channel protein painless-like n=1 Tax=Culicoides brevitarsis TaxID=469753 RepID=UPI00307CB653